MERNDSFGQEYLTVLKNKTLTGKDMGSTKPITGHSSFMNRYALFTYSGKESIDTSNIKSNGVSASESEITALQLAQSSQIEEFISDNPRANRIINYFKDTDKNAVEYDWADFLYLKHYGLISNNYMVTLRRFPFAVNDNIFNKEIVPNPDIARCIAYWGEGTDNDLNSILGFTTGFNWRELTSEIQTITSQKWGNQFTNNIAAPVGQTANILTDAGDANGTRDRANSNAIQGSSEVDATEVNGYYHNKILGPVNVIDKMTVRDRGLKYEQSISLNVDYELKSYPGISPKEAMLDILTNLLTIGYNNAPFFGGAFRYQTDRRNGSFFVGGETAKKALLNGRYEDYLKAVGSDLKGKFDKVFKDSKGEFSFDSFIGGFMDIGKSMLSKFVAKDLSESGALPNYQVVNALLTGESTGEWHLTVGNPLNPIAIMGNLILDDMSITFSETLGNEDFPLGIRAEFKLRPARPRDKTDIENMFNLGQGRMHYIPAGREDILNIQGNEKYYYGVVNGKGSENNRKKYNNVQLKENIEDSDNNTTIKRFRSDNPNITTSLNFHSATDNNNTSS